MSAKPSAILPGTVEKIIKSPFPSEPEEAQITVEGGDHLYREMRIENTLTNENGEEVSLKPGAHVEVAVEAEAVCRDPMKLPTSGLLARNDFRREPRDQGDKVSHNGPRRTPRA